MSQGTQTLARVRAWWAAEAGLARAKLRLWAERHAPHVPLEQIDAIANAVGEISIDEAHRALTRLEAEYRESAPRAPRA